MHRTRRLLVLIVCAVAASVGVTVAGTAPAHADTVVHKKGPDRYGTFNDIRYATATWRGYFGQVTWSHHISLTAKEKWRESGGGAAGAAAVAAWLCGRFPTPPGQATCAYYLARSAHDFRDTIAHVDNTTYADRCISFRWYAAAVWNAGRTVSPVRCWTEVDYCASCGYDGSSGGAGGGGGGGSWRPDSEFWDWRRTLPEAARGNGAGGTW